jgi:four helix bundle protein
MSFHHEKLTIYRRALDFARWSQRLIESITKKTSTRDHLERAAEGNGKFSGRDRARFFQIAHGSALESAACLDLFVARQCCESAAIGEGKALLEEIVRMLFKLLDNLDCRVAEDWSEYGVEVEKEEEEDEEGRGSGTRSRKGRY